MKVIKTNTPIPGELLDRTCPRIALINLTDPNDPYLLQVRQALLKKRMMDASLSLKEAIQDPSTVHSAQIKTRLESKGFKVSKEGQNLRAPIASVQGKAVRGVELKVTKTQPAALGVLGTSAIGQEVQITQKGSNDVLRSLGGLQKPGQIDDMVASNGIKPTDPLLDNTQPRSVDPVKKAQLCKKLKARGSQRHQHSQSVDMN